MMQRHVCAVVLLCSVLLPAATAAQPASGVAGVVRDTSGAILPGVTVEASSPALIERVRTVSTDVQGRYNIVGLVPGVYSVTFTLPGFSTFKRDGIELAANFTATVNAESPGRRPRRDNHGVRAEPGRGRAERDAAKPDHARGAGHRADQSDARGVRGADARRHHGGDGAGRRRQQGRNLRPAPDPRHPRARQQDAARRLRNQRLQRTGVRPEPGGGRRGLGRPGERNGRSAGARRLRQLRPARRRQPAARHAVLDLDRQRLSERAQAHRRTDGARSACARRISGKVIEDLGRQRRPWRSAAARPLVVLSRRPLVGQREHGGQRLLQPDADRMDLHARTWSRPAATTSTTSSRATGSRCRRPRRTNSPSPTTGSSAATATAASARRWRRKRRPGASTTRRFSASPGTGQRPTACSSRPAPPATGMGYAPLPQPRRRSTPSASSSSRSACATGRSARTRPRRAPATERSTTSSRTRASRSSYVTGSHNLKVGVQMRTATSATPAKAPRSTMRSATDRRCSCRCPRIR